MGGIIPTISCICKARGIRGVKVARLGGLRVLLSFPHLEESLQCIQAFSFDFEQLFSILERWVPGRPCCTRVVWVRCLGVPLVAWDREVFKEIGDKVGKVIEVAKETMEKEFLEFERIRLRVEDFRVIKKIFYLKSFGYSYPISVIEEQGSQIAEEIEERAQIHGVRVETTREVLPMTGAVASQNRKGKGVMICLAARSSDTGSNDVKGDDH